MHMSRSVNTFCMFLFLSTIWNLAVCVFLLRIYLPNSFQVMWVLGLVVPTLIALHFDYVVTTVHTFVSLEQIINLW